MTSISIQLKQLGLAIRDQRKKLKVTAQATADAAGISRVSLYRLERGEGGTSLESYLNVLDALGLNVQVVERTLLSTHKAIEDAAVIPVRINLSNYPELKLLAWHLPGATELSAANAHGLYLRNWRHVNPSALDEREKRLINALGRAFDSELADDL